MGIMQNKVTRRVVLGSIAAGLGGASLVLCRLRGAYETDMPTVTQSFAPARVKASSTVTVNGYTLKVPPVEMEIKNPGDWEKYKELSKQATKKALDNDPGYKAHLERQAAALKEKTQKDAKKRIAASTKQPLEQMEADIQRFNEKIDKDNTIDAENKELLRKGFRESMKKSYEKMIAQIQKP